MSDHPIEGSVHSPQRTDDAAVLAAYREVTGWTDEEVLHYATCNECAPDAGDYEWYCENSPNRRREREEAAARRPRGEPVRPQPPLAAALRREADRIAAVAKALVPLHHGAVRNSTTPQALARIREATRDGAEIRFAAGGVTPRPFRNDGPVDGAVHGAPGGPYCGVCGAPIEVEPLVTDIDLGGFVKIEPGRSSCPNGCDPRLGRDR